MDPTPQHPELQAEQEYFDRAAEHRERRRARALDPSAGSVGIHRAAAAAVREANKSRAGAMGGPDTPVAFWRLSDDSDEIIYIGRFPILDESYDPIVISWKADQASRFQQATRDAPIGVKLKRFFTTDANTIIDIADEWLVREQAVEPGMFSQDALLRALAQRRDGRLTDIVTTIERAQDEVMRAPSDGILVIQGGPGTGKTVIGLQRISLIAYRETLESKDLLFVGPSGGFLQYVSHILPTLGDDDVSQLAITSLAPFRPRTIHREPRGVARIKGDSRMVELLSRALRDRRTAPESDTSIEVEGRMIVLSPSEVLNEMKPLEDGGRPHNLVRDALRERLIHVVVERANDDSVSRGRLPITASEVRGNTEFNNFLDRVWPTFSPQEFLRDLLASQRRLRQHRWDLFEESEILIVARPPQARLPDEPWSAADLALIDEIEVLLNGLAEIKRYQHVIVDEAQDLSPMQLRAIRRRRAKGITILGDLAQATGPWAHTTWEEVTAELGPAEEASVVELTVGYRVPAEVMAVASRIAESLNLPVTIPEPVRGVGELPRFVASDGEPAARTALTIVREYLARGLLVGLIAPDASIGDVAAALRYEDLPFGDGRETTTRPITLLSATASKGLEFDAVVVLEPMDICDNGDGGLNELFVAVTRTTTALAIVHAKALPLELASVASPDNGAARPAAINESHNVDGIPDTDLADGKVGGIVDDVATAITDALDPAAIDEFLSRLTRKLKDLED